MRRFLFIFTCALTLFVGCDRDDNVALPSGGPWIVQRTEHGVLAIQGDWIISANNGEWPSNPDSGLSAPGVNILYKMESVGGGGLYNIQAAGKTWNERVPFIQVARPSYSLLNGYALAGEAVTFSFRDTVGSTQDSTFPAVTRPLSMNVTISVHQNALSINATGMYLIFPSVRDTVSLDCLAADLDTLMVVTEGEPHWSYECVGPITLDATDPHFRIHYASDAPLMKLDIGSWPPGDFMFLNFDHSLVASPPEDSVNTSLVITPVF